MSTSSVLRKEDGDTYVLDTKYYGKYRFSAAATLASADAASAEVYAAERTDGCARARHARGAAARLRNN